MHAALLQEFKKHITLTAEEEELIIASFRYKKVKRNQVLVQPPDLAIYVCWVALADTASPAPCNILPRSRACLQ